jgi:hypothetical protein
MERHDRWLHYSYLTACSLCQTLSSLYESSSEPEREESQKLICALIEYVHHYDPDIADQMSETYLDALFAAEELEEERRLADSDAA